MSRVPGDHETIMRQPRGEYVTSEASVHARALIHAFTQLLTTFRLRRTYDCHRAYMRARLLMQIGGEQGPFNVPCDYKKGTRTRFYFEDATSDKS